MFGYGYGPKRYCLEYHPNRKMLMFEFGKYGWWIQFHHDMTCRTCVTECDTVITNKEKGNDGWCGKFTRRPWWSRKEREI